MIRFLADADLNEGIVAGCLRREPNQHQFSVLRQARKSVRHLGWLG